MDATASAPSRWSPVAVAMLLLAVVTALAIGVLVGVFSAADETAGSAPVQENSVDVGFARAMRTHHEQAVEMSVIVRDATRDRQIRNLALDIELTQEQQMGQMFGWLALWGYGQASTDPPLAWMRSSAGEMPGMGHESPEGNGGSVQSMPGMASQADLRRLERSRGENAERLYLQLMIPHHTAGVAMAHYALQNASQPQVRRLAQSIVTSQTSELKVLRSLLAARGGPLAS